MVSFNHLIGYAFIIWLLLTFLGIFLLFLITDDEDSQRTSNITTWGGLILSAIISLVAAVLVIKVNPPKDIPIEHKDKVYLRDETAKELPFMIDPYRFLDNDFASEGSSYKCYENLSKGDFGPGSVAVFYVNGNQVVAKINDNQTTAMELEYDFIDNRVRKERVVPLIELDLSEFTDCATFGQQYVYDKIGKD